jgi:hypothetical protein
LSKQKQCKFVAHQDLHKSELSVPLLRPLRLCGETGQAILLTTETQRTQR